MSTKESESTTKRTAEVVLPCTDLDSTLEFFTEKLRFQIHSIFPADNPREVVICGFGLRLRLVKSSTEEERKLSLRINVPNGEAFLDKAEPLDAPNGLEIEFVESNESLVVPKLKPSLLVNKVSDDSNWIVGRAGMRYRDLIPDRLGGAIIASHIHVPKAGPVPDYVHFHDIRFQMIYCYNGWAKLVYEDQGEPFIFEAGDCVLQPPLIRHRVLESSKDLEVIEISSPAEHETFADNEMELPNETVDPNRVFDGQKFIYHKASEAVWNNSELNGFTHRDLGIASATKNLVNASVLRSINSLSDFSFSNNVRFSFMFLLAGKTTLCVGDELKEVLHQGDCFNIPSDMEYSFSNGSEDLELLKIGLREN